jgi:flagellar biosynthesis protein FlhG
MLKDQALELRRLVRRAQSGTAASLPTSCVVSLAGGRPGVGVTSVALNLAVGLTELGARVVLVDADLQRAELARVCRFPAGGDVGEILADRRDVHEVLAVGPAGMHLLPGTTAAAPMLPDPSRASRRLWRQLRALGRHAEVVLLDSGAGTGPHLPGIWQAADVTLLVTTPDHAAITETYATIKRDAAPETRLQLIVNRANNPTQAEEVHQRLAHACRRFLDRELYLLGTVPDEPLLLSATGSGTLLILEHPESLGALAFSRLAESLQPQLDYRRPEVDTMS